MFGEKEKQLTKRFEKVLSCLDFGKHSVKSSMSLQQKEAMGREAGKPAHRVQPLSIMFKEVGIGNTIWPNPSNPDKVRIHLTLLDKLPQHQNGHPKPRINVYLEHGASSFGKATNEPCDGSAHLANDPVLIRITTDSGNPTFNLEFLSKLGNLLVTEGSISP